MSTCPRSFVHLLTLTLTISTTLAQPGRATPRVDAQAFLFQDPIAGEAFAFYGNSLAAGDWNLDGVDDVAVGVPSRTGMYGGQDNAGAVYVYTGNGAGMSYTQPLSGLSVDQNFGSALASGRFLGTQADALLVGASGETVDGRDKAGRVHILAHQFGSLTSLGTLEAPNPQADERFGQAFAVGDFNGDGFDDVAIGMPEHDVTVPGPNPIVLTNAGAVAISYGSAGGLQQVLPAFIYTRADFAPLSWQNLEFLGRVLAAGDFNGDGFDDLAIGSPLREVDNVLYSGEVLLMEGGALGLLPSATSFVLSDFDPAMVAAGERFGSALAVGDFDGALCLALQTSCYDDLAIGAQNATVAGVGRPGVVAVAPGTDMGLTASTTVFSRVDLPGPHMDTQNEQFGAALLAGSFDDFPGSDLVVGAPRARVISTAQTGAAFLVPGDGFGLLYQGGARLATLTSGQEYNQQNYGDSLAAADLDGNGHLDLLVGVPFYPASAGPTAGAVELLLRGPFFVDGFESGTSDGWSASTPD